MGSDQGSRRASKGTLECRSEPYRSRSRLLGRSTRGYWSERLYLVGSRSRLLGRSTRGFPRRASGSD